MSKPVRSPSMTWVRAFCEAARHGSFKAAAGALNVSPSTISHEVRNLEDWLQTPLFNRTGRGIALTEEGARLFESVVVGFDHLDRTFERFTGNHSHALKLGLFPFLASEILLPGMRALEQRLNGETIELISSVHLSDLADPDPGRRLDAVVRYSEAPPLGYEAVELTGIQLGVVVGAALADRTDAKPLKRIRGDGSFDGWKVLENAGAPLPSEDGAAVVIDNYLSALRAVEQGLGAGVAVLPLSAAWLAEGRICLWSSQLTDIPERYWFVYQRQSPHAQTLAEMAAWLRSVFDRERSKLEALI